MSFLLHGHQLLKSSLHSDAENSVAAKSTITTRAAKDTG